jgi:hypothetical protein
LGLKGVLVYVYYPIFLWMDFNKSYKPLSEMLSQRLNHRLSESKTGPLLWRFLAK